MAEIAAALHKHPCPECGGDAVWNAGKQALGCPYCGHVFPWQPGKETAGATIKEHDLVTALANVPDQDRGWQEARQTVQCQSCHAIMAFAATRAAQNCDFCGSPSIIPHQAAREAITPESILPFSLSEAHVRENLRIWYGSHWLAPRTLKRAALTDTLHGLYIPYWTFDSHVHAAWQAEAGTYYYETEHFTDTNGQRQTRQIRKVRWQPAAGELDHFFDDALIPGTVGVRADYLRKIEPFPTTGDVLKPYEPAFVRGWVVERYQVDLRQAAEQNFQQMETAVEQMCAAQIPGDTHRNLHVQSQYAGRTFKHVLFPVWIVSYTFGSRTFQIVVNGHTGAIHGTYPHSWVKIFFFIILPLLALITVVLLNQK